MLSKDQGTLERRHVPKALAAWNTDETIRWKSTSGGVFSALAIQMLVSMGYVAGAVHTYTADFSVIHVLVDHPQMLEEPRRSKYVQSYTGEL